MKETQITAVGLFFTRQADEHMPEVRTAVLVVIGGTGTLTPQERVTWNTLLEGILVTSMKSKSTRTL